MAKILSILTLLFGALSAICGTALACVLFCKFIKKTLKVKDALLNNEH